MSRFERNVSSVATDSDPTTIPFNLDAERGVLGGLLLDADFLPAVRGLLSPDDFFRDAHQVLYRGILSLDDAGSPVDSLLLSEHLQSRGEYGPAGGDDLIAEILASVPHAVNTSYYAQIVREKALARHALLVCQRASEDLRSGRFPSGRALERASRRIDRLLRLCQNPNDGPIAETVCIEDVEEREVQWLWPGRIPSGKVTMCAGEAKLGKSFFTTWLAAAVSVGKEVPCGDGECIPLGSVVLLSAEDDLDDTVRPRLSDAGADLRRVHALTTIRMPDGSLSPFTLGYVPQLAAAIDRIDGVRLVVIDPITQYIGSEVDDNRAASLRAALGPLKAMARDRGVAVVVVSHLNKGSNPKALNRVLGSGAYTAFARANWLFYRDPDDPKRRLMLDGGNNLAADPTGLAYRIVDGRIEWEPSPVTMSADDFLAEARDRSGDSGSPTRPQRAQDFLAALLPPGTDLPSEHVLNAAKAAGLGRVAMFEAKKALGIGARKAGGRGDPWHWFRPPAGYERPEEPDEINF